MNEEEITEAETIYSIEELFGDLGEKIYEEYKPEVALLLTKLWLALNELGITNEAARHALRAGCLNKMAVHFEYECNIMADHLRDDFRSSASTAREKDGI